MTKLYAQEKQVFDINKVTVVGSPTITSDGVASGFSRVNNIELPYLMPTPAKSLNIKIKFNITDIATGERSLFGQQTNPNTGFQINIQVNNTLRWVASEASQGDIFSRVVPNFNLSNGDYLLEIVWDGATYKLIINGEIKDSWDSAVAVINYDVYCLGNRGNLSVPFTIGSIDLEQFKIYVDGELVYSPTKPTYLLERRKEGFDLSKFTIAGSPTITDDGVASGFSASDYLQLNTLIDYTKPWEIELPFKTGNTISAQVLLSLNYGIASASNYLVLTGAKTLSFRVQGVGNIDSTILTEKTDYIAKIGWDGNKYYLKIGDGEYSRLNSNPLSLATPIYIGRTVSDTDWIFQGSINLKQFSITIDGKEVFTGAKEKFYAMRRM